jgi:hypothetical protein
MIGQYFVYLHMEKMYKIMTWLNELVGKDCVGGEIVKIITWQVIPTGRPYEYGAVAQVEVKR